MQRITWVRLLAAGALAAPLAGRAQAPQPKVREIATMPGVAVDEFVRLPNGRVLLYTTRDSILAYDLSTKHTTLVATGFYELLRVSRAGDRIVYCRRADVRGGEVIWSMPIDPRTGAAAGTAQRVSLSGGDYPSISPDGRTVAFSSVPPEGTGQDLSVVPVTGGAERVVAKYGTGIKHTSWSDDGKWIYVNLMERGRPGYQYYVERVPSAGGRSEPVFSHSATVEGTIDGQLAIYPEDEPAVTEGRMTYLSASGARGDFRVPPGSGFGDDVGHTQSLLIRRTRPTATHIVNLSDGAVRELLPGALSRRPAWSPDGRRIALQDSVNGHWEITVMNADGSQQRHYPEATQPAMMYWSPNGQMLMFVRADRRTAAVLDLATGTSRNIGSTPNGLSDYAWRADGKAVILLKRVAPPGDPQRRELFEASLDGTERRLHDLAAEFPGQIPARLIPDRVVMLGSNFPGAQSAGLLPFAGGPMQKLPELPAGANFRLPFPGLSPDGRWLLFLVRRPVTSIQLVATHGDSVRTVSLPFEVHRRNLYPPFLPDGRQVVLVGQAPQDPVSRIYVVPLDGAAPRAVAAISGAFQSGVLDLSPDGRTVVFTTDGAITSTIFEIDLTSVLQAVRKQ